MAFAFCTFNGYLQASSVWNFKEYQQDHFKKPVTLFGTVHISIVVPVHTQIIQLYNCRFVPIFLWPLRQSSFRLHFAKFT